MRSFDCLFRSSFSKYKTADANIETVFDFLIFGIQEGPADIIGIFDYPTKEKSSTSRERSLCF